MRGNKCGIANLPVDVVHGIQENAIVSSRIKNDAPNRHMPFPLVGMEFVGVAPPCSETVITFPYIKHLPNHGSKVGIGQ